MTTARAQLHAQLTAFLQHPTDANFATEIQAILSGYRLQYKSKTAQASDQAKTARQALGASLQAMAADKSVDLLSRLAQILDEYRMQHKAAGKAKKRSKAADDNKKLKQPTLATAQTAASSAAKSSVPSKSAPAAKRAKKSNSEPVVARSVTRRGVTRSECPKCHSMGVVLARSYAEDEYYSCIYCGWQGFKVASPGEEQDSLAARLLGIYKTDPSEE